MATAEVRVELAVKLASAFINTTWTAELVAESGAACLDDWPPWIPALAQRVVAVFRVAPVDRQHELFALVLEFLEDRVGPEPVAAPGRPLRVPAAPHWPVLNVGSVTELAARLELTDGQLAWLADVRGLERNAERERLRNYRYMMVPRRRGIPRMIEAPKLRLKTVQRWILAEILGEVPPHAAAHGFVAGRSAVTHAELHTDRAAVLRLDLEDFFASVGAGRVYGIWRALGYRRSVAHVLTGLTTNVVPASVWRRLAEATEPDAVQPRFHLGRQLATPHLPQGAPTSPALANLASFRLDRRLSGLASASGLTYSRYADDLIFSGSARLIRRGPQFEAVVREIVRDEGFRLNEAKTATQTTAGRQTVCGVVVNAHTNVRRSEYDELRAILHNAARSGPAGQNRDELEDFRAHLLGRISWVRALNPTRARRLDELYTAIDWS